MINDVDAMRDLLFILERRQVSPRATIMFSIQSAARDLNCRSDDVLECLNLLQSLDYIEGPGQDEPGCWLFRKLTRKGVQFVRQTRSPQAWERIKAHFAAQRVELGT